MNACPKPSTQVLKHAMECRGRLPSGPPGSVAGARRKVLDRFFELNVVAYEDAQAKEAVQQFVDR